VKQEESSRLEVQEENDRSPSFSRVCGSSWCRLLAERRRESELTSAEAVKMYTHTGRLNVILVILTRSLLLVNFIKYLTMIGPKRNEMVAVHLVKSYSAFTSLQLWNMACSLRRYALLTRCL